MKPRYLITGSALCIGIAATFCLVLAQWFVFKKMNEPLFLFAYNSTVSLTASFFARKVGNRLVRENLQAFSIGYSLLLLSLLTLSMLLSTHINQYLAAGLFVLLGCTSYFVKIFDQILKNVMGKYRVRKYLKFTKLLVAAREASPLIAGFAGYWLFYKSGSGPNMPSIIATGSLIALSIAMNRLAFSQSSFVRKRLFKPRRKKKIPVNHHPSGLPARRVLLLSYVPYVINICFAPFIPIYISKVLGLGIDMYYASFVIYGAGAILGTRLALPYIKHAIHKVTLIACANFFVCLGLMCFMRNYGIAMLCVFMIALMNACIRTVRGTCLLENVSQNTYARLTTKLESNSLIYVVVLNICVGILIQLTSLTYGFLLLMLVSLAASVAIIRIPMTSKSKRQPEMKLENAHPSA